MTTNSNSTTPTNDNNKQSTNANNDSTKARRRLDVGQSEVDPSRPSPSSTKNPASSPSSSSSINPVKHRQATMRMYRQRTLKDYQIMLEFRHLKEHSPTGMYILPSMDDLRKWSGVLFLRKGLYKGGIFRFYLELPQSYPADGACPRVTFLTDVYHPHVNSKTGRVDILSHFNGKWIAGEHYIVVVLSVLKSMFFFHNTKISNIKLTVQQPKLLKQWNDMKGDGRLEFMKNVRDCVSKSIELSGGSHGQGKFVNPEESIIKFSKHQKQHDIMKQNLLQTGIISGTPFVVSPKLLLKKKKKSGRKSPISFSSDTPKESTENTK